MFLNVNDGLKTCLARVIPSGLSVLVDAGNWQVGPVFGWMAYKVSTYICLVTKTLMVRLC